MLTAVSERWLDLISTCFEFKPAFTAWLATKPFENPRCTCDPVCDPEVQPDGIERG
jgi:hypothetical protein